MGLQHRFDGQPCAFERTAKREHGMFCGLAQCSRLRGIVQKLCRERLQFVRRRDTADALAREDGIIGFAKIIRIRTGEYGDAEPRGLERILSALCPDFCR
jgi:hypothetical protein